MQKTTNKSDSRHKQGQNRTILPEKLVEMLQILQRLRRQIACIKTLRIGSRILPRRRTMPRRGALSSHEKIHHNGSPRPLFDMPSSSSNGCAHTLGMKYWHKFIYVIHLCALSWWELKRELKPGDNLLDDNLLDGREIVREGTEGTSLVITSQGAATHKALCASEQMPSFIYLTHAAF
jgi:hypothetical protein